MGPAQDGSSISQQSGPDGGDLNQEFGLGSGRRLLQTLEAEIGPEAASKVLRAIGARLQARVNEVFLGAEDLASLGKATLTPEQIESFVNQINMSSLRNKIEQASEVRLGIQDIQQVLAGTSAAGRQAYDLVCQALGFNPEQVIAEAKAAAE
ncbi:MAG: hypothetical protein KDD64_14425 [Bdellovibrionales bacterium]|nr:hypothetical protein [Bdellovibrionales bacterium]